MRCAAEEDSSSSTYRWGQGSCTSTGSTGGCLPESQEGSSGSTYGRLQGVNCALPRGTPPAWA